MALSAPKAPKVVHVGVDSTNATYAYALHTTVRVLKLGAQFFSKCWFVYALFEFVAVSAEQVLQA